MCSFPCGPKRHKKAEGERSGHIDTPCASVPVRRIRAKAPTRDTSRGNVVRVKAIRRLTVRPVLPDPLRPLSDLARNLRWSWHPETRDLFHSVDPECWTASGGDPVRLLGTVRPARLAELAEDRRFLRRLTAVAYDLDHYMTGDRWYQAQSGRLPAAVAYFSPEFGITAALPQYSGGLGILAGDHLKAASDLGVPLVGVGLLYRHGYFRQSLSRDGWQQEHYPVLDPHELPLAPRDRKSVV